MEERQVLTASYVASEDEETRLVTETHGDINQDGKAGLLIEESDCDFDFLAC